VTGLGVPQTAQVLNANDATLRRDATLCRHLRNHEWLKRAVVCNTPRAFAAKGNKMAVQRADWELKVIMRVVIRVDAHILP
jgi:hypothetical protein